MKLFYEFIIMLILIEIICNYRPSPSLKQTQLAVPGVPGIPGVTADEVSSADRCSNREDYVSTGSLAGSIASASSGFGSLPKKRPALFSSGHLSISFFSFVNYIFLSIFFSFLSYLLSFIFAIIFF